ncbi:uncharacterized protein DEA37_0014571 [Paragonimus westermani]|uniref:protein phosphatase methylesterase-1 n=1 Tax=Paragonimus westermani TaxID=34504 RepID=A0A5J4NNQ2_9TREM|nr:uncharacterized protein DEA37_0014571 [Paragonimus westermani]
MSSFIHLSYLTKTRIDKHMTSCLSNLFNHCYYLGSALSSLQGMTAFLKGRPQSFQSLSQAIEWSVRCSQLRNSSSARVSFPGQLKRIATGQTATWELERGTAVIFSHPTFTSNNPNASKHDTSQRMGSVPQVSDIITEVTEEVSDIANPREPADGEDLPVNPVNHCQQKHDGAAAASEGPTLGVSQTVSPTVNLSDTSPVSSGFDTLSMPHTNQHSEYTWRIDLMKTQPFWHDWFYGLSQRFLSIPEPKLLLIAGVDRLDKELTIGQMQGKFQLHVFPKCGHAVHEDVPDKISPQRFFASWHARPLGCLSPYYCDLFEHFVALVAPTRAYATKRQPQDFPLDSHLGPHSDSIPGGVQLFLQWWRRLRPLRTELADARRRLKLNKHGMDPPLPFLTRYFVRFPFLTDSEFARWRVTTDSDLGVGYSWAEFVRSPRNAPGCAIPPDLTKYPPDVEPQEPTSPVDNGESDTHPMAYTYPPLESKWGPRPGSKQAASTALVSSVVDDQFKGYGVFRGFISTRVPERGDIVNAGFANVCSPESTLFGFLLPYGFFSYTHLVIRYRGDGRSYRINILPRQTSDISWYDTHHFVLYTRGGPYWEIAKIPLSKFFILRRGLIRMSQHKLNKHNVRMLSFTLMDDVDGPFSLELDYIGLYLDPDHKEQFAYEQYDRSGIVQ